MRYKSNLTAPDLSPYFKLRNSPKLIMGHDAPSDPDYEPECTFWTHDEAAILYNVVKQATGIAVDTGVVSTWIDVGARFGWTTSFIAQAGANVIAVDPILRQHLSFERFMENAELLCSGRLDRIISDLDGFWLNRDEPRVTGVVIDGNHDSPYPLHDAYNAHGCGAAGSVIMFHDFWGKPIRDGVKWLIERGYSYRVYYTPNGVACCWRGLPDFQPPDHMRDPCIDWWGVEVMLRAESWL